MNTLYRASLLAVALASCLASAGYAAERSWSYTYNNLGLIETANGPRTDVNDITTYSYDSRGRLTQVSNALGHTTHLSDFDNHGNPRTVVDSNGVTSTFTYTPQGWLASTSVSGSTTSFEYDAIGQIIKVTRGDGSWLAYTWSAARRLTQVSNNLGEVVEYTYDPMGNRTSQRLKDASGTLTQRQTWAYDELGRLLRTIGAEGQIHKYGYDLNDNPTLSGTPKQHDTHRSYDALNRLVSSTDPLEGVTNLAYDAQDNLTQVVDPRGVITHYEYDGFGNLTKQVSPDSGITIYTHDAAGNVISKTDARNVKTTYTYDALNRLTDRQYPASPALNVQYHYDITAEDNYGMGRLTAIQDASGITRYVYDARGNLVEHVRSVKVAGSDVYDNLAYTYDSANQLVRIDYPAGISVAYPRNNAGQVVGVTMAQNPQSPSAFVSGISYLPFGPLKSLEWANGVTLSRSYDQDYRLTEQIVGGWNNTYDYDANSNLTTLNSNLLGDLNYSYDALDRLTVEQTVNLQQTYSYDVVGNRISKTITPIANGEAQSSTQQTYLYASGSNRLTQIDAQAVTTDAAGNITQDRANRKLVYDVQNRLISVNRNGNLVAEFGYNALGQRIYKRSIQGITTFLYGPDGQLLGEQRFNDQGSQLSAQYYIWLDSMPLGGVSISFDPLGSILNIESFYLHSDHLNTPRVATYKAQDVWQWQSDAFGNGQASGSLVINLRFPGQYFDQESGLYYNYFRDYDPETGRYVESDPIGLEGGLNTYGYVGGNPLSSVDYYGLSAMSQVAGNAAAGIVAGAAAGSTGHQGGSTLGGWGEGGGSSGRERESRDQNAVYKGRQTTPNPISHGEENRIISMGNFPPMHDCEALKRAIQNLRKTIEWRRGDLNPAERGTMNYVGHVTRIRILRETLGALERAYRSRCGDPAECGSAN